MNIRLLWALSFKIPIRELVVAINAEASVCRVCCFGGLLLCDCVDSPSREFLNKYRMVS